MPDDLDDVGVVEQAIHCGGGEEIILEEWSPFDQGSVGCDDRTATFVASSNEVVQVEGLVAGQWPKPEVVNDQEIGIREAEHLAFVGIVGPCRAKLEKHFVCGDVEYTVADDTGTMTESLGDVAFPDSGGTDQADVLALSDKSAGSEVDDLRLGDLGVEGKIEVLKGLGMLEARPAQTHVELLGISPFGLVDKQTQ